MAKLIHCAIALFTLSFVSLSALSQDIPKELLTVAESSDFKATSRSQQVVDFVDQCAKRADYITRMDWGTTVEGRPMVSAVIADPPYDPAKPDGRLVVLLLGNIHSGECAGKEGLLMLLRDITLDKDHPWIKDTVTIIAPNYNADANDRVGKNHRRGQNGPEQGMGVRENAQQLDLNRDFMKLESNEARALVALMDKYNPHVFMDLHTTDGSRHRYQLTYDIPHNPNCPKAIRDFMRGVMMPAVTKELETKGFNTFYYGNFNRDYSSWTTYGHEPRYSTEYAGIRGRLGILSEAYSYAPYEVRIRASKAFTESCVNFARANAEKVKDLLDATQAQVVAGKQREFSLDAKVQAFDKKFKILGYKDDEDFDYEVDFIGDYKPINTTILPHYYVIPREHWSQVNLLRMHGIKVMRGPWKKFDTHEKFIVKEIRKSPRPFQGHQMQKLETERVELDVALDPEAYYVSTRQPLGLLAAALLEPESNDSLATWNFFDRDLKIDAAFPVTRGLTQPTRNSILKITRQCRSKKKRGVILITTTYSVKTRFPTLIQPTRNPHGCPVKTTIAKTGMDVQLSSQLNRAPRTLIAATQVHRQFLRRYPLLTKLIVAPRVVWPMDQLKNLSMAKSCYFDMRAC